MRNKRTVLYLILIVLSVAAISAGTFLDLSISEKLYIGDCLPAKIISFLTVFLFISSCFFFLGVLFRQLWERYCKVSGRIITGVVFIYLFCSTAALGGAKILFDPLFEGRAEALQGTLTGSLITGSVFFSAFFLLGALANGKRNDPEGIKTLIKLIAVFTFGFLLAHYLNCMIDRPSYARLISEGGITDYKPWYEIPKGSRLLMSLTDLISSQPGSFVSSHALYAVLFIVIFPSYSLAFPALEKHRNLLMVTAGIISVAVIICRMISGDNYLTDISFAALYSLKFCLTFDGFKIRPGKKRGIDSLKVVYSKGKSRSGH